MNVTKNSSLELKVGNDILILNPKDEEDEIYIELFNNEECTTIYINQKELQKVIDFLNNQLN